MAQQRLANFDGDVQRLHAMAKRLGQENTKADGLQATWITWNDAIAAHLRFGTKFAFRLIVVSMQENFHGVILNLTKKFAQIIVGQVVSGFTKITCFISLNRGFLRLRRQDV